MSSVLYPFQASKMPSGSSLIPNTDIYITNQAREETHVWVLRIYIYRFNQSSRENSSTLALSSIDQSVTLSISQHDKRLKCIDAVSVYMQMVPCHFEQRT